MTLAMRWAKRFLKRLGFSEQGASSREEPPADGQAVAMQPRKAGALCSKCRRALVSNPHQVRAGRARARNAPRDGRGRFLARAKNQSLLAIIACVVLVSFGFAYAAEIPCRDLEAANADELLATIDPRSIQYVPLGKSGCNLYPGQKVCEFEQTLEDDQMLDPDHRLLYIVSSHLTGSGFWQDFLVFGCVSGQVKKVFFEEVGRDTSKKELFASAPLALRPELMDYMNHLRAISPIDCRKVLTELQMGKSVPEVAKDMNVLMGGIERCREAAAKIESRHADTQPASNPQLGYKQLLP